MTIPAPQVHTGAGIIDMVSKKFVLLLAACLTVALMHTRLIGKIELRNSGCLAAHFDKTLVVHIFADTDPEYLENLKFFVQYGILQEDNADYIVLVQTDSSTIVRASQLSSFYYSPLYMAFSA